MKKIQKNGFWGREHFPGLLWVVVFGGVSAIFFLSAAFALFAGWPLVMARMGVFPVPRFLEEIRKSHPLAFERFQWFTAVLVAALTVGYLGGGSSVVFFSIWVALPSLVLPELLIRKVSLDRAISLGTLAFLWASVAAWIGWAVSHQGFQGGMTLHPRVWVDFGRDQLTQTLQLFESFIRSQNPDTAQVDDLVIGWKTQVVSEFPSAWLIGGLLIHLLTGLGTLRFRPQLAKKVAPAGGLLFWKAPDFLVWVAIVLGGATVLLPQSTGLNWVENLQWVSWNALKVVLAIYAVQGMSIVWIHFLVWRMSRFFRFLGASFALIFGMPLLIALGFFDLWFDFRKRFRQT